MHGAALAGAGPRSPNAEACGRCNGGGELLSLRVSPLSSVPHAYQFHTKQEVFLTPEYLAIVMEFAQGGNVSLLAQLAA